LNCGEPIDVIFLANWVSVQTARPVSLGDSGGRKLYGPSAKRLELHDDVACDESSSVSALSRNPD